MQPTSEERWNQIQKSVCERAMNHLKELGDKRMPTKPVHPGEVILDIMEEKNLSIKDVAEITGLSGYVLCQYIDEENTPTPSITPNLAKLKYDIAYWRKLIKDYRDA